MLIYIYSHLSFSCSPNHVMLLHALWILCPMVSWFRELYWQKSTSCFLCSWFSATSFSDLNHHKVRWQKGMCLSHWNLSAPPMVSFFSCSFLKRRLQCVVTGQPVCSCSWGSENFSVLTDRSPSSLQFMSTALCTEFDARLLVHHPLFICCICCCAVGKDLHVFLWSACFCCGWILGSGQGEANGVKPWDILLMQCLIPADRRGMHCSLH